MSHRLRTPNGASRLRHLRRPQSRLERMILEEEVDALIVTQRVTAAVMGAVIDVAHTHQRRVMGQIWAVDGEVAANSGHRRAPCELTCLSRQALSGSRLLGYRSIADRLALASRAWASLDWDLTLPIMEAMVERGVCYCGMHVITQFQVGDGLALLENDIDFRALFSERERRGVQRLHPASAGRLDGRGHRLGRRANDMRMEWMQRFRSLGGQLLAGTDMQFGGIMLHRELANLQARMSPFEVITTATGVCAKAFGLDHSIGLVKRELEGRSGGARTQPSQGPRCAQGDRSGVEGRGNHEWMVIPWCIRQCDLYWRAGASRPAFG